MRMRGGTILKIKQDIDIGQIVTVLVFVGALVGWGMDMEKRITKATASVEAFERVQEVRWKENNRRMDAIRSDITILEQWEKDAAP